MLTVNLIFLLKMVQKSKGGKKSRSVISGKKKKNAMKHKRKCNYKKDKKKQKKVECCVCMEEIDNVADNTITCGKVNHTLCRDCKMKCEDCPMCRSHKIKPPISQAVNLPIVKMNEVQTPKHGQYGIGTQFRLVNMLSSRMNGKELKKAMELVFINASYEFNWDMKEYSLAQTPLNQCIAVSESLLSEFKSSNNLQVVNAIYLTDGENNGITGTFNFVKGNPESNYDSNKVDRFELNRVFGSYNSRASYLVDQKTKKQYRIISKK